MDYQTFKNRILNELQDFYGSDARTYIVNAQNDNGVCYEGICVEIKGKETTIMPLASLYACFASGNASLVQCTGMIVDANREGRGCYVKENEGKPCDEYLVSYQG